MALSAIFDSILVETWMAVEEASNYDDAYVTALDVHEKLLRIYDYAAEALWKLVVPKLW